MNLVGPPKMKIGSVSQRQASVVELGGTRSFNGSTDIRPPGLAKDDIAISVALAAAKLPNVETKPAPFMLGEIEYDSRAGFIPGNCHLELSVPISQTAWTLVRAGAL
jgi:hypothetical protein